MKTKNKKQKIFSKDEYNQKHFQKTFSTKNIEKTKLQKTSIQKIGLFI
jgi:hypothetical protein